MKTPEEILESHCPSMSNLFLDKSGRRFRDSVIKAMEEYAQLMLSEIKDDLKLYGIAYIRKHSDGKVEILPPIEIMVKKNLKNETNGQDNNP